MAETTDHASISRQFISKAEEYVGAGDLLQASEKAWGAAAHAVKAVAEKRGWEHSGHRELFRVIGNMAVETGRPEMRRLFHVANSLHSNFYEGWLGADDVSDGIEAVKELLALLPGAADLGR